VTLFNAEMKSFAKFRNKWDISARLKSHVSEKIPVPRGEAHRDKVQAFGQTRPRSFFP